MILDWLKRKMFEVEFKNLEKRFKQLETETKVEKLFQKHIEDVSQGLIRHFSHYLDAKGVDWDARTQAIYKKLDQVEKLLNLEALKVEQEKVLENGAKIQKLIGDLESKSKTFDAVVQGLGKLEEFEKDLQKFRKFLKAVAPLDYDQHF